MFQLVVLECKYFSLMKDPRNYWSGFGIWYVIHEIGSHQFWSCSKCHVDLKSMNCSIYRCNAFDIITAMVNILLDRYERLDHSHTTSWTNQFYQFTQFQQMLVKTQILSLFRINRQHKPKNLCTEFECWKCQFSDL